MRSSIIEAHQGTYPTLLARSVAEFIATFALLFVGTGAVIVDQLTGGAITPVGVALAFGLVVMVMIYAIGPVSGAHLNPAVSLGFWVSGRFTGRDMLVYWAAQLLGAFAGTLLLSLLFPDSTSLGATVSTHPFVTVFLLEVVLTFLLMFVIINVATGSREQGMMAGSAIGGTIALAALFGGPITGASMNPARSLSPAVVAGIYDGLWIYLVAPMLGSAVAIGAYRIVQERE